MFAKHLRTFNIAHICIGTVIILLITNACTDNIRHKPGMWSIDTHPYYVYNQHGNNYLNTYRKLYWYGIKNPILPSRNHRVRKILVPHGYRNNPRTNTASHENRLRNEGALLPKILGPYFISSTSSTRIQQSIDLNNYHQPNYKNHTICKESKNLIFTTEESKIINDTQDLNAFADSQDLNAFADTSSSVSKNIEQYQPFVAHTYFTLDDVIIPYIPENVTHKSNENISQQHGYFAAQERNLSNNANLNILDTSFYNINPIRTTETLILTTTTVPPPPTFSSVESTLSFIKVLTESPPYSTFSPKKEKELFKEINKINTVSINETEVLNATIITLNNTSFTHPINLFKRKQLKIEKLNNSDCDSCTTNHPITTKKTLGNIIKVNETKLENVIKNARIKSKKLDVTKLNITKSYENKGHKAYRKGLSISMHITSTEPTQHKNRRNKTNLINMRRRKLTVNVYNKTQAPSLSKKTLWTKPEVKNQTKIIDGIKSPNIKLFNTITSTVIATTKNISEVSALTTESAIMTISNTNVRKFKRLMPRFQKHLSNNSIVNHTDFVHTTNLPQLPIEVYFTKLNQ